MGSPGIDDDRMTARPRKPLLVNLTWAVALVVVFGPVLYVFSYAPLVKCRGRTCLRSAYTYGSRGERYEVGYADYWTSEELRAYRPIGWLTQETPLRSTLLLWERLWGIERPSS
jgi:hypothetical protein